MSQSFFSRRSSLRAIALALALPLAGCGVSEAPPAASADERLASTEAPLYIASGKVWPYRSIPVCWENPGALNGPERGWVRAAVERTWQRYGDVYFHNWGACSSDTSGIRIRISDEGPHTKGLGYDLDGKTDGMVLNFTFNNWSAGCSSSGSRQFCIESIAVHEFGHALAYSHEQNRSDTPTWCDQEQGTDGDVTYGAWDLDSVMNYCNPEWNGNGTLSATDIRGHQRYYGVPFGTVDMAEGGPGVASWGPGRLDLFVRGADGGPLWKIYNGSTWTEWSALGGVIQGNPAAVSWGTGRIDVVALGMDNAIWLKSYNNGSWSGWSSLGGSFNSSPAIASRGAGRLDVFARNGSDNAIWIKSYNNGVWSSWHTLGGVLTSHPAAVSRGDNTLDVFARGTDNAIWQNRYNGSTWSGWTSLGGLFGSSPAVVSRTVDGLDVFVRDADGDLYQRSWNSTLGWGLGWFRMGSYAFDDHPAAVSWDSGRIDLFTHSKLTLPGSNITYKYIHHSAYTGGFWQEL
jgi:hypothetical protein